MVRKRHLAHAPIREALIDIAVRVPVETSLDLLGSLQAAIASEFPRKQEIKTAEVEVDIAKETNKFVKTGIGWAFRTEDEKRVVQFRTNGFTFNWLKPYTNWKDLRSHAQRMWQLYADTVRPEVISRLAVRYINQLELPLPMNDFAEFITAQPVIPAALPQKVGSFFTRVAIHDDQTDCGAVITQVFEGLVDPKVFPLILDIDASKLVSLKRDDPGIWLVLDQLRDLKNDIFFESLTEEAVRLFE